MSAQLAFDLEPPDAETWRVPGTLGVQYVAGRWPACDDCWLRRSGNARAQINDPGGVCGSRYLNSYTGCPARPSQGLS